MARLSESSLLAPHGGLVDDKLMSDPESASTVEKILALLAPLKTKPCLFKTKDWWTYEFCYGRDIKQYHVEGTGIEGF